MQHDQEIRKEAPEIFISTGNHSIGSFPKALNGVVGIDTNCVDEGKNTLSGLCDAVAQQTPISEIPTLLLPKGPGTFLATGKNRALLDMNQVLPPDRKGVAKYRTIYLCLNYMPVRTLDEEAN